MKILAFDTALNACSVAITDGPVILGHAHEKRRRGHAEALMPMIESQMHKTDLSYSDLDLIAVTVGPGTFTGLRIGLAAARGLALAAKKPLLGVTTLEALAVAVPSSLAPGRPIIATADARRGEIYLQAFERVKTEAMINPLAPPAAVKLETVLAMLEIKDVVVIGSGGPLLESLPDFSEKNFQRLDLDEDPDARYIARLALARGLPPRDAPPPTPLYLRAPDAKLPGGIDPGLS